MFSIFLSVAPFSAKAQSPIKDVLLEIDAATGKAKDTAKEFSVTGIVAAKLTLPDNKVVAFVLNAGEPTLAVVTDPKEGASLIPRNEVTLAGRLGDGPFGTALLLMAGSVSVSATNKPFGISELRGAGFFKDATSLAGRYVQLTNVTIEPGKFSADGTARAKSTDGTAVTIFVSKSAAGRDVPAEPVNVFGIPIKVGGEWHLVAARFLLARARDVQGIAAKRTCLTCHNPDTKLLGPPYREIAARYRNDADAVAKLMSQMEKGGVGKWGPVPMPGLGAVVPPEERKALAEWIMSYRWDAVLAE
jgi:cytochrome c